MDSHEINAIIMPLKDIDLASPFLLSKLLLMTYPSYRRFLVAPVAGQPSRGGLAAGARAETTLAVAAFQYGVPISLALGVRLGTGSREVSLLSVFTDRDSRNLGLATLTVKRLVTLAGESIGPGAEVSAVYEEGRDFSAGVNTILDRVGFGPATPRCSIFRCDEGIAQMPWLSLYVDLPRPFEMVDWVALPGETIEGLARSHAESPVYPEPLSPFRDSAILEPSNSMALMRKGELAGWSITHRPMADTIRYSGIFVKDSYRGFGLSVPLLMESIRRHVLTPMAKEAPNATFVVYHDNPEMLRMVKRRMSRYAKSENISVERRITPSII